jgi:hypothetical protein
MTPLERITKRVNAAGDPNDLATPRPELTLEEFFEGNEHTGSIWCNLSNAPHPREICALFKAMRARPNVADVRVEITMFDDPEGWPFSDTIWIVTSASPEEVKAWFDAYFAPDDCDHGWADGAKREAFDVPEGMRAVRCWWD